MSRPARCVATPRDQRGQVLLMMLLVVLVGGAALLLDGLSSAAQQRSARDAQTARALADAKAALIAWALSHPQTPGRLPFPDRGTDGAGFDGLSDCVPTGTAVTGYNVEAANLHLIGQFPWRGDDAPGSGCLGGVATWELSEPLVDGSGNPLWYAVSDKLVFNGNGGPINVGLLDNNTPGTWLTVRDARGNILNDRVAAVIIAPGEALAAQDRGLATGNTRYPLQFLDTVTIATTVHSNAPEDGDGNGIYLHDGEFVVFPNRSEPLVDFNDRLVYITAHELLRAAEKRVVAEVAAALRRHRQVYGAYPWLSPFRNPFPLPGFYDAAALAQPAPAGLSDTVEIAPPTPFTRFGHVATTDSSEVGETQETGYTITWTAGDAAITGVDSFEASGGNQVVVPADRALMVNNVLAALPAGTHTFPFLPPASGRTSSCDWQGDTRIADCVGTTSGPAGYAVNVTFFGIPLGAFTVYREYTFDVSYLGDLTVGGLQGARVRDVGSGASFQPSPAGSTSTITVRDYVVGIDDLSVTRTLALTTGSTGTVDIAGIYLEPLSTGSNLPGDLPPWFSDEQWNRYILVGYAGNLLPTESMAVSGTSCRDAPECITLRLVDWDDTEISTQDGVMAVVIGAGPEVVYTNTLPPPAPLTQDRHAVPQTPALNTPVNFVEGDNVDLADGVAEWRTSVLSMPFNDHVRIVELQP